MRTKKPDAWQWPGGQSDLRVSQVTEPATLRAQIRIGLIMVGFRLSVLRECLRRYFSLQNTTYEYKTQCGCSTQHNIVIRVRRRDGHRTLPFVLVRVIPPPDTCFEH